MMEIFLWETYLVSRVLSWGNYFANSWALSICIIYNPGIEILNIPLWRWLSTNWANPHDSCGGWSSCNNAIDIIVHVSQNFFFVSQGIWQKHRLIKKKEGIAPNIWTSVGYRNWMSLLKTFGSVLKLTQQSRVGYLKTVTLWLVLLALHARNAGLWKVVIIYLYASLKKRPSHYQWKLKWVNHLISLSGKNIK